MSAPKVTVLSGKTAEIVVAQEFRYPEEYDAILSSVGTSSGTLSGSSAGVTITAGTPRNFKTRNIGVEMRVTPIVEADDRISLRLEPSVTEFEGFIEYGGSSVAVSGNSTVTVPSGFFQPIFSTRRIATEVTIDNGATVVMGGLTREEVKAVRDKIPILGDIPLLGKLFRSRGQSSQKRNLLIFVTARLSDSPNFDGRDGEIVRVPSAEVNQKISTDGQKKLTHWKSSTKTVIGQDRHRKISHRRRF
jgi:general secretion pathway protein D